MIFSISDHVEQIKSGSKTQTRRKSPAYIVGKTYSIQPGRTKPGIQEGRILITDKREEWRSSLWPSIGSISKSDALAEGGYTPIQFEYLFRRMYPEWVRRYAYTFKFIPTKRGDSQ